MQPRPHPSPNGRNRAWRSRLSGHIMITHGLIHEHPNPKALLCAEIQERARQLIDILNDPKHEEEAKKLLGSGLNLLVKIEVFEEDRKR